jgi:hypothetical protein
VHDVLTKLVRTGPKCQAKTYQEFVEIIIEDALRQHEPGVELFHLRFDHCLLSLQSSAGIFVILVRLNLLLDVDHSIAELLAIGFETVSRPLVMFFGIKM